MTPRSRWRRAYGYARASLGLGAWCLVGTLVGLFVGGSIALAWLAGPGIIR